MFANFAGEPSACVVAKLKKTWMYASRVNEVTKAPGSFPSKTCPKSNVLDEVSTSPTPPDRVSPLATTR